MRDVDNVDKVDKYIICEKIMCIICQKVRKIGGSQIFLSTRVVRKMSKRYPQGI